MKYRCYVCKTTNGWFLERCPRCARPGSLRPFGMAESKAKTEAASPTTFRGATPLDGTRVSTGMPGFDRVLGYNRGDPLKRTGLYRPIVVLFAGENGCGKSTLLMQFTAYCADRSILYNSTEQPLGEIRSNAEGIGLGDRFLDVEARSVNDLHPLLEEVHKVNPHIVIVDSLNDLHDSTTKKRDPTEIQVDIAKALMEEAFTFKRSILLISHLNADGNISGREALKHAVSTTLMMTKTGPKRRHLKAMKNRFGGADQVALFDMEENGLVEVEFGEDAQSAAQNQQSAPDVVTTPKKGMF